jgi:phosphatidylserine/phosphatidylglycerophosphate/cardiolipin synthase-like enzyme
VEHVVLVKHPTVLTGSFNFTKAADQKNAENLLVVRDVRIAAQYEQNWHMHFSHSEYCAGK